MHDLLLAVVKAYRDELRARGAVQGAIGGLAPDADLINLIAMRDLRIGVTIKALAEFDESGEESGRADAVVKAAEGFRAACEAYPKSRPQVWVTPLMCKTHDALYAALDLPTDHPVPAMSAEAEAFYKAALAEHEARHTAGMRHLVKGLATRTASKYTALVAAKDD